MPFRVLWTPYAEERLADYLQNDPEPHILAGVARQIDRILVGNPATFGESRYDTNRIAFMYPLGVQFEVMDDVRTVIVHDVWRIGRK